MIDEFLNFLNSESNLLQNLVSIFTIFGVIIAVITVILTMINLKAVVRQVYEMQLQRTHSQEPDLFIEPVELFVNFQNEEILFAASWSNNIGDSFSEVNPLPFKITNIGNGVAKYVSLKAYIEKDYLNELIELDKDKIFNLRNLYTDYGMEFFQYEYGEDFKKKSMHNYDMDSTDNQSFNYIRPEQSVSFLLNKSHQAIFNIAILLNCIHFDSKLIPRMKVLVTYYDSFNNKYEKDTDIYIGRSTVKHSFQNDYDISVNFKLEGLNRLPNKDINLD